MDKTQLVSFEITTECNLADAHAARCPNRSSERYRHVNTMRPMTDGLIIETVRRLYQEHDFGGLIAWHYYCEPLCDARRMFGLMERIRDQVPEAEVLLWTNGTLLDRDLSVYDQFAGVVMTYYGQGDLGLMQQLAARHPKAVIARWPLDGRLEIENVETDTPCTRPFCEMPIDYFGNVHACCYDWKGLVPIGNLWALPLSTIIERWQAFRGKLLGPRMALDAPRVCRCCRMRPHRPRRNQRTVFQILPGCVFAPEAAELAESHVQARRIELATPQKAEKVAVVFVSYLKVPEARILEHFEWNGSLYEEAKARVYVVTDRYHELPHYAECVLFPETELPQLNGKRTFSLCKTKNAGIRKALDDGAEVLVCLDVDTAIPTPAIWEHLLAVQPHEAKVPMVAMVPRSLQRAGAEIDKGVTNTIAMTALNWNRVQYDERCVGYGADDGIIVTDIRKAGLMVDRSGEVFHVDHPGEAGARNQPGRGRGGCYGRDDGFNAENFAANKQWHIEKLRQRGRHP